MAKKGDSDDGMWIAGLALLALAVAAAISAQKKAKENDVPYVIEEDGELYKIFPNGSRRKVGDVKNPRYRIDNSRFDF